MALLDELLANFGGMPQQPPMPLVDPETGVTAGAEDPFAPLNRPKPKAALPLPGFGAGASALPFGGLLSETGLLNAPNGAEAKPDLPPSTNDPSAAEPTVMEDGVPLPRPRPVQAGATPMSLAPKTAETTDLTARGVRPAPEEGFGSKFLSGVKGIINPQHAGTLLALGAGFAGAPSLSEGMRRGFGGAARMADADRTYGSAQESKAATYRALVAKGVPPVEALAASQNPDLLKGIVTKYFETKPMQHVTIKDMLGNETPLSFDQNTGRYRDAAGRDYGTNPQGAAGGGQAGSGEPDHDPVTGRDEKFLESIPDPTVRASVKAMANGDVPPGRGPIQKLLPLATRYDKNFTGAQDYNTRLKTQNDYKSGIASRVTKSINTTIDHGFQLYETVDKMGNAEYLPWLNPAYNAARGQLSPEYQKLRANFDSNKEAFVKELDFAMSGGRPTVSGQQAIRAEFDANSSPSTMKGYIERSMKLLESRLDSHAEGYNQGLKSNRAPLTFVYDKNQDKYRRLLGAVEPGPSGAAPAPAAAPKPPGITSTGVRWSLQP